MNLVYGILFRFYQRFISPYKGFTCAHRHVSGGVGCSKAILEILNKKGFVEGKSDIIKRLDSCTEAASLINTCQDAKMPRAKKTKRKKIKIIVQK